MIVKRKTLDLLFIGSLVVAWFLLVLLEVKTYVVWQQILDIGSDASALVTLFSTGHAHFLRYLLMLPTIKTADFFTIPLDTLFGLQIILLNCGSFILLNKVLNHIWSINRYSILLFCLFFSLSLFMNGRITFAFFGISLILYTSYFYLVKSHSSFTFFLLSGIGLVCMAVSSGTFMVGLISIVLFSLISFYKNLKIRVKNIWSPQIFLLFALLAGISPLAMSFLNKNLDFFEGSFVNMLSHGIGVVFYNQIVVLFTIILLPIILLVLIKLFQKALLYPQYLITFPVLLSAIFIGMFGHSSLFVGLPAVFMLICSALIRGKYERI